jgi:hypothetical protein
MAKRARLCMLNGAFVSSSSLPVAQILRRRRSRREWLSITTDRGDTAASSGATPQCYVPVGGAARRMNQVTDVSDWRGQRGEQGGPI